jgi:hypothetical protein
VTMPLQPPSLQRPLHLRVLAAVRIIVVVAACLQGLASRVGFGAKVGRGGAALRKVAGEDGLKERSEDDLGTTATGQSRALMALEVLRTQFGEEPSRG